MVIHLWGKFWMAAWRGHRALTWMTGVVAFLGSIGTAFTGYLSQSNFDAQWISAAGQGRAQLGRDRRVVQRAQPRPDAALARRAAAVRLGVLTVAHVVLVRRHGVVPPLDAEVTSERGHVTATPTPPPRPAATDAAAPDPRLALVPDPALRPGQGVRHRPAGAWSLLTVGLAAVFSSPDEKAITLRDWAAAAPTDVVATAAGELAGTTTSATYGPPYNSNATGRPSARSRCRSGRACGSPSTRPRTSSSPPWPASAGTRADGGAGRVEGRGRRPAAPRGPPPTPTPWPRPPTATRRRSRPGDYGPVPVLAASFLALAHSRRPRGHADVRRAPSTAATRPGRCCCSPTAPTSRTRPGRGTSAATSGG